MIAVVTMTTYTGSLAFVACIVALMAVPMILLGTAIDAHRHAWAGFVGCMALAGVAMFGVMKAVPSHAPLSVDGNLVTKAVSPTQAHEAAHRAKHWTYVSTQDDGTETWRTSSGQTLSQCTSQFAAVGTDRARFVDITCTNGN